ncbi:dockerin type I domain-containing protein [Paenibacillus amylolyticus]|uniref:dockerin type I domain-containing protein n=1 Tax=Paenibacillus TaxID=44249 RepID=UPI00249B1943|nr:dockerin type I domain-containing protein [Paenibacillus amylolyticus]WFA87401.1 Ig-like domain-containing protein [Paenibacillus amylolyticus]
MKGKQNKKRLKPILKKSMLTALGLGIALPIGGTLPQANAGEIGQEIKISQPVLSEYIHWLSRSSQDSNQHSLVSYTPIEVLDQTVIIDLNTHFPLNAYDSVDASSNDNTVARVYVNNENKLVVIPYTRGKINIELKANYTLSGEPVKDNFELYISKQGDVNNDGKVNSADAAALLKHLRNELNRRSYSAVEMNRMDVDRDGGVFWSDPQALLKGYAGAKLGAKDNRYVLTFKQVDDTPYALNAQLIGEMKTGVKITSTVEYFDADGDYPNTTLYQWYQGSDATGANKTEIAEATSSEYTITASDVGKYIFLEVTPRSISDEQPQGRTVMIGSKEAVVTKQGFIQSLSPSNLSTGVDVNAPLIVTYNQPIKANTNGYARIVIKNLTTNQEEASYMIMMGSGYAIDGNTVTISNPTLKYSSDYSIEIINGAFMATADNASMPGTVVEQEGVPWTFTTKEGPPPPP